MGSLGSKNPKIKIDREVHLGVDKNTEDFEKPN